MPKFRPEACKTLRPDTLRWPHRHSQSQALGSPRTPFSLRSRVAQANPVRPVPLHDLMRSVDLAGRVAREPAQRAGVHQIEVRGATSAPSQWRLRGYHAPALSSDVLPANKPIRKPHARPAGGYEPACRARTRRSRAASAITSELPPWDETMTTRRNPSRWRLSPTSPSIANMVPAVKLNVPAKPKCSSLLPTGDQAAVRRRPAFERWTGPNAPAPWASRSGY
jgi:hypothetical protein